MSLETARKLDPYLKRAAWINVWGYGESLLNPRFFDLMDHCRKFKGSIQLFTNGTTLTEAKVHELIKRKMDSLVISLDGATAETVQATRSDLSLNDLIDKIARLNELKAEHGVGRPNLSISFTASAKNIHELPDLIKLAARLKVGTIFVSIARIFHPSFVQESLLNDPRIAAARFQQAQEMGRNLGVHIVVQELVNEGCHQPFELLFVKWNGDVFGCCASAFHSSPRFQIFLGNVHQLPLDAIWNGEHIRKVRQGLTGKGPLNEVCGSCPYYKMTLDNLQKRLVRRAG
jgi:MoaA/NifB/PqqE/SkfB family radical SAM enzyme